MFDRLVDEYRTHSTEWLVERRDWLVREQRRLHVEELAVTRVLDERGQIDDAVAQHDGVSIRDLRDSVETAFTPMRLLRKAALAHLKTTQKAG